MDNISPRAVIMTRERLARWRDDSVPVRPAIRTKQASERAEHAEFEEEPLHSPVG
ncbi:hypothetical protein [Cohnella algarum]|nr:hypothetical protein [Cohnella algarum]MBN2983210.1 hypothetical protein [Cohnella algarum]